MDQLFIDEGLQKNDKQFIEVFESDEDLFTALQEYQKQILKVKNRNSTEMKKHNLTAVRLYTLMESKKTKSYCLQMEMPTLHITLPVKK